jgi:hypothetical protein
MENKVVNLKVTSDLKNVSSDFTGLKKDIDNSKKSSVELNETIDNTGKKGNVFSKLTSGLGALIPGFKGAEAAGQGVLKTLFALVANPIGAVIAGLVLVLTTLFKAFTSTKAGGEALERVLDGIGAVVEVLRDRVLVAGSAIAKFLTGDFKGAFVDAKAAASGLGKEIEDEFKQAGEARRFLQEVTDAVRDLSVSRAKLNRDLAGSKEIINDENASFAEKKKAIDAVRIAEERQTKAELANAEKKLAAIIQQNKLSDTLAEGLDAKAAAEAALFSLQEQSATNRRNIARTEQRAVRQEQARLKEISDKSAAVRKIQTDKEAAAKKIVDEAAKKISDDLRAAEKKSLDDATAIRIALEQSQESPAQKENREYLEKKTALEANNLDTELLEKIHQDNLNKITTDSFAKDAEAAIKATADNKANADAQQLIDKKLADSKIENLARGSAMLSNISELIGQNTAAGKVAAVAAATIDTYAAAQSAFKNAQANPISIAFPAYPFINAGLAIAGGLKNVKSILAVKTPKGGGGGSVPSGGGMGAGPSAPAFNVVGASPVNQLAQTLGDKQNVPIKAYVVSGEVSTAQALDRNIIKSATLG